MVSAANSKPPSTLCGAAVLQTVDLIHASHTGNTRHITGSESTQPASHLAIARSPGEPGFYLYYCDDGWGVMSDTWHRTIADAEAQAEFEYQGSANGRVAANAV